VVLLEGEGKLAAFVQLSKRGGERRQAEGAKRLMQMGRSDHPSAYAPGRCTPLFGSGPG
jgi:hypothetical protein